jgi:isopentenyl-diphosphate delta-isomerase
MDIREKRKIDHIKETIRAYDNNINYFRDISLIPMSSSTSDLNKIDLKIKLYGKNLDAPILINAMTGGAPGLEKYNEAFSVVARENNIAFAVGSQKAGLVNKELIKTYSVVRKVNPNGLIFANLSALENIENMERAVDMIQGDALQLHINHSQELSMAEGDRDFSMLLKNIENAVNKIKVPIILKEVGNGISKEAAKRFFEVGIRSFDVGGFGGTNFSHIEEQRKNENNPLLSDIGIPTPASVLEVKSVIDDDSVVFVTGGIRSSNDIVKSLILGGDIAGIAAYFLKKYIDFGGVILSEDIGKMITDIKKIFVVLGFNNLADAKNGKYILKNEIKEWIDQRI